MCLSEEEVGKVAGSRSYLGVGQVRMDKRLPLLLNPGSFLMLLVVLQKGDLGLLVTLPRECYRKRRR